MIRRNFTLVELVVSLGILLAIMLISTLALSGVQQTWRSVSAQEQQLKTLRALDHIAETAFRNAVPFYWRDRDNKERMLFSGETNSVTLTYLHRIDAHSQGGIRFLKIYREGRQLIAEYRQLPFLNDGGATPGMEREVLADNVAAVTFLYADRRDKELDWFEFWEIEDRKNLPLAIQMEVRFQDGTQQIWLRRTAGNGQFQEWGRRLTPQKR